MKFNINKEQLKMVGKIGLKIGKQIVIDGAKALVVKGALVSIETAFSGESVKSIKLDDVLSGKKSRKENLLFTTGGNEEVINIKTGDIFRKVSLFEQECASGLKAELDRK